MQLFALLTGLLLSVQIPFVIAQVISKDTGQPGGYNEGFATQDPNEEGKKSICHTNCGLPGDNAGNTGDMLPGVYAAAVGPEMGGDSTNCGPCGSCYEVINSGNPYCTWQTQNCPVWSGDIDQKGPKTIKVMVVNHCMNCNTVPGWFDIANSPGWNNPRIWWRPLQPSDCRGNAGSAVSVNTTGNSGNPSPVVNTFPTDPSPVVNNFPSDLTFQDF